MVEVCNVLSVVFCFGAAVGFDEGSVRAVQAVCARSFGGFWVDISKKVFWVWGLGFAVRIRFYDPSIGVVHRFCYWAVSGF